jgi:hypothetical protein
MRRHAGDVGAFELDRAAADIGLQARDRIQRRGLAGAVGAEKRDHAVGRHRVAAAVLPISSSGSRDSDACIPSANCQVGKYQVVGRAFLQGMPFVHRQNKPMLDLRKLRYFSNVVEARSISKAADSLHVAQPALSKSIQALEQELGTTLLQRSAKGIATTEAGARLYEPDDGAGPAVAPPDMAIRGHWWGARLADRYGKAENCAPLIQARAFRIDACSEEDDGASTGRSSILEGRCPIQRPLARGDPQPTQASFTARTPGCHDDKGARLERGFAPRFK